MESSRPTIAAEIKKYEERLRQQELQAEISNKKKKHMTMSPLDERFKQHAMQAHTSAAEAKKKKRDDQGITFADIKLMKRRIAPLENQAQK